MQAAVTCLVECERCGRLALQPHSHTIIRFRFDDAYVASACCCCIVAHVHVRRCPLLRDAAHSILTKGGAAHATICAAQRTIIAAAAHCAISQAVQLTSTSQMASSNCSIVQPSSTCTLLQQLPSCRFTTTLLLPGAMCVAPSAAALPFLMHPCCAELLVLAWLLSCVGAEGGKDVQVS